MAGNVKKKKREKTPIGIVHVNATYNNTIVTITDLKGDTLFWSSSGSVNFKGSRKSTPYAAQVVAKTVIEKAQAAGMASVDILVKGPGIGRDNAVRTLVGSGIEVKSIRDITPIPHNGCRARKSRRI